MKTGYYPTMTREQYDAVTAMHYSKVKIGVTGTMRDLHAHMCAPNNAPDKACFLVGRALEDRIDGVDVFDAKYIVAPEGFRRGAEKKWAGFLKEAGGREILSGTERAQVEGMHQAIVDEPIAAGLMLEGDRQPAIFWRDSDTGVDCKGVADRYNESTGVMADLKTSKSNTDKSWRYAVRDYCYDVQAAMYPDGMAAVGKRVSDFIWVIPRKSWPYTVNLIRAPYSVIEEGRSKYRSVLARYAKCKETGVWPGYGGIHDLPMDYEEQAALEAMEACDVIF